jgi:hypothetical protein
LYTFLLVTKTRSISVASPPLVPGSVVMVSRFSPDGATHSNLGVLQDGSDKAASIGNVHRFMVENRPPMPLAVDARATSRPHFEM